MVRTESEECETIKMETAVKKPSVFSREPDGGPFFLICKGNIILNVNEASLLVNEHIILDT